jgi:2-dehydropantoate 2-reductase
VNVAVLGPGGVGGLVAGALDRADTSVVVVAREETAATISARGLRVSSVLLGDFVAHPRAGSFLREPVDALIIATKAAGLREALERIGTQPSLVLPLLNGLDHITVLREHFGDEAVVAGTIRVEADRPEPGVVVHTSQFLRVDMAYDERRVGTAADEPDRVGMAADEPGRADTIADEPGRADTIADEPGRADTIADEPGRADTASDEPGRYARTHALMETLAGALSDAGIPARVGDSEAQVMWSKLVRLNALALTTSAFDKLLGEIRSTPELRAELVGAIEEGCAVARAEGASIPSGDPLGELTAAHDTLGSSMQRDIAAGRPPELDAIPGSVLRAAARHEIECPTIERLVAMISGRVA